MLVLNNLTEQNIEAVLQLEMEGWQAGKYPAVAEEIARAYVAPDKRIPLVIAQEHKVIGFMVFEFSNQAGTINLPYFMIARQEQSKGFGSEALRLFIDYAESLDSYNYIRCCVGTGDLIGRKTLEAAGFMRRQTDLDKRESEMLFIIR